MSTQHAETFQMQGSPWTFGDRLRKARRSMPGNITQAKFAELLGYPAKRYEAWENDRNLPGSEMVDVARAVAREVPGFSAAFMLGLEDRLREHYAGVKRAVGKRFASSRFARDMAIL